MFHHGLIVHKCYKILLHILIFWDIFNFTYDKFDDDSFLTVQKNSFNHPSAFFSIMHAWGLQVGIRD